MVNCGIGAKVAEHLGVRTVHWVKTSWKVIRKWRFCPDNPPWTRPLNTVASRGSNQVAKAKRKFGSLRWPHLHYAPHWGPTFWPEEFFVLVILRIWISFGYNLSFFIHSFNTVLLSIYYELVIKIVAIDTIVNKHRHNPCPPTKILLCSFKYFFLHCKIALNQQIRFKTSTARYLTVARGGMVSCIPFPKYCFSHSRRDKRSLILLTDLKAGKKLIPQVQFQGRRERWGMLLRGIRRYMLHRRHSPVQRAPITFLVLNWTVFRLGGFKEQRKKIKCQKHTSLWSRKWGWWFPIWL